MNSPSSSEIAWHAVVNSVAFSFCYRCIFKNKQNKTRKNTNLADTPARVTWCVCVSGREGRAGGERRPGKMPNFAAVIC